MINDELLGYIRQQLSKNVSKEIISSNLKSQGWTDADVNEAFGTLIPMSTPIAPIPPSPIVKPTRRSKKIIFIILALVLLGVLGGGVYAYYSGVFVSLPSLASQAIDSARAAKSANYDITVSVDLSGINTSGISQMFSGGFNSKQISLTSKGSYDSSDSENFKGSSTISFNAGSSSVEAEFRVLNKTLYAVLTKAPAIAFLPVLTPYENKWITFPLNESSSGSIASNPIPMMSPINPDIFNKLTTEQKDHIYQMTRDAHFVKTVQRLSPETIGGESSYHFIFDLDREGIVAYAQALKEYINTIGKNDSALSSFNPNITLKDFDAIKDFQGEIWIGRNDKLLHKFILNFGVLPDAIKTEQIKINIVGIFSNWNEPVSIIAPGESITFEALMSSILGDSLGVAREKGKEASIKANMANLRAQAEIFYDKNKSYSGFCLSKEVKTAQKSIENSGGKDFICKDKKTLYAVGVKLSDSSGYWCIDSTGANKSTTSLPSGTVCPVK